MADHPKLTVLFEKLRGKTFEIDKDQMSIGRRDGMDICIKDSSLSGHHADIIRAEQNGKTNVFFDGEVRKKSMGLKYEADPAFLRRTVDA